MDNETLNKITETIEGHKVKDLRWLKTDNIIVGLVECPILNKVISGQWRKHGVPTNTIRGRKELTLKMD